MLPPTTTLTAASPTTLTGLLRGTGSAVAAAAIGTGVTLTGGTLAVDPDAVTIKLNPSGGDDTAALQSALDDLAAAGGGTLRLGAGTFNVTTTLDITGTGSVVFEGDGPRATVVANSHNTAPTIRVLGNGSAGVGGWSVGTVIRNVGFNPTAAARDDDAPEVDVQYAIGCIVTGVTFGHPTHDPTLSKVGTCVRFGDIAGSFDPTTTFSGSPPYAACYVIACTGSGCHRVFDCARGIDVKVIALDVSSVRASAQGFRFRYGTEAFVVTGCEVNNGAANPTGEALLIEAGSRYNKFSHNYWDSYKHGVRLTGGEGNTFSDEWFGPVPGSTTRPIEVGTAAVGTRFTNCICVYGTIAIDGTDCNVVHTQHVAPEPTAVAVGATARKAYLHNLDIDNDPYPARFLAGSLSSDPAVALSVDAAAGCRWRDVRHTKGGFTQYVTDGDQAAAAVVRDTFTAADGTALNGRTPPTNAGNNWATLSGTAANQTVQSNKAALACNGAREDVVVDAGTADGVVSADLAFGAESGSTAILTFRVDDASNLWQLAVAASGVILYKIVGGAVSQEWDSVLLPAAGVTYTPVVTLSGSSITVKVGPLFTQAVTDSFNATKTKYGVGGFCSVAGTVTADNFCVTGG